MVGMHLNWVHEMHDQVDPIKVYVTNLVSSCLSNPFPPRTDTTTRLMARHLPLVARQLLTNAHASRNQHIFGAFI